MSEKRQELQSEFRAACPVRGCYMSRRKLEGEPAAEGAAGRLLQFRRLSFEVITGEHVTMDASEVKEVAGALAALMGFLAALLGIPKYLQYRTRRDKMALIRDDFKSVVKALASGVEVERLAGAILLRRFFDPASEVGMARAPYTNEVVNVIASILRSQQTGPLQKTLVDSLAYAPSLQYADFQKTNLQNAYLGSKQGKESKRLNLSHADFYRSDLSGGSIKHAVAQEAVFYQARLHNTVLKGADLRQANFFEADLQGAVFDGALLNYANLKGADLRQANFFEADLQGAVFEGALLKGAKFKNARNVPALLADRLKDGLYPEDLPFVAETTPGGGPPRVFLSKSASPDYRHDQLIERVRSWLDAERMAVVTLERPEYPSFGSFAEVKRLMAACAGAVIVGFRDLVIKDGVWREGTKEEAPVQNCYTSTEWTQIEAGMAIMAGLPALIISESGIRGGVFDIQASEHLLYRSGADDPPSSKAVQDWCMAVRQLAAAYS